MIQHAPATLSAASCINSRTSIDGKSFVCDGQRLRIRGVTYGPFVPNARGEAFPTPMRVECDFELMRHIGVNAVRTYHDPPDWFLTLAQEQGMLVFVDIPWPKHLCFLESEAAQREARSLVRAAATRGQRHACVLSYSIGNEIPANIVRWHGAKRVERFLAELCDVARQADPQGLVTYSNYPSTEYLTLPFLDFVTFNVYLHDPEAFRRYLFRLQNQVDDRPLVLGEIGMDTLRYSEEEQAEFLTGHLRETTLMGLAGAFVFSWTDDWYTGGYQIEDWAFGITRADRSPKPAYSALGRATSQSPADLAPSMPFVSVVVCSYNGATTLEQCLRSLLSLDYPHYEVILVDDGSTDDTRAIAARFPCVRVISQENQGLSAARNVGMKAAIGPIIAYTDSDCFADPDWLAHLIYQLERSGADAVGGPNLTPEDGWLAACVAASPGQPTHVLENDQTAEHIPGCNMAFRREALEAINGFMPQYRKAGDDVDVCWRLQQAGQWITFAPGAVVWHHRRQNPRTYLRQQAGYGEAEALLWFDHPDRFNSRGESKWRGTLYGISRSGLRIGPPAIYRGTFGCGLFQTIYQPGVKHWAMLPNTLEWYIATLLCTAISLVWQPACLLAPSMLGASVLVVALLAATAPLAPQYRGLKSCLLIGALSAAQPAVRSWWRFRTRLFPSTRPAPKRKAHTTPDARVEITGRLTIDYWDEQWRDRTELLDRILNYVANHRWAVCADLGWSDWDIRIHCHPWTSIQLCTAQEDHGSGKRRMRARYRVRPTGSTWAVLVGAVIAGGAAIGLDSLNLATIAAVLTVVCAGLWHSGLRCAEQAAGVVDLLAKEMGLIPCKAGVETS